MPASLAPGKEGEEEKKKTRHLYGTATDAPSAESKAAHHAISTNFEHPIDPKGKPLVIQYEAKFQKGLECGGAYIKLLTENPELHAGGEYTDKTPFTIMFGPDRCGQTNKVHFIFRHKNPVSGEWVEHHFDQPPLPKLTKTTALYTLIVNPDNTFKILINEEEVSAGSLLEDFSPPVNPPKEIDDPTDSKPADWVDIAEIDDVAAVKPADWDEEAPITIVDEEAIIPEDWLESEPLEVADPDAEKPEEWDEEEDGDWVGPTVPNPKCADVSGCGPWTAPKIRNPEYKGKWTAPKIPNPEYKGVWAPRKIDNPDWFEDLNPANLTPLGGIGIELWTMTEDILFDNIYIGHDVAQAKAFADETFGVKRPIELELEGTFPEDDEEAESFVDQARLKFYEFVALAQQDPIAAVKTMPEVIAAAVVVLCTFVGLLSGLLGLFAAAKSTGPKQPTVVKKTAVKKADDTKAAPVAKIEEINEDEASGLTKRATRSSKE